LKSQFAPPPMSIDYFGHESFAFNGTLGTTKIAYPKK
jgi:hypothetical protein